MAKDKKKDKAVAQDAVVAEAAVATADKATTEAEIAKADEAPAEAEIATEAEPATEEEAVAVETEAEAEEAAGKEIAEGEETSTAEEDIEEDEEEEEPPLSLEEQLELARQEAAKNLENWQRTAAEMANFKRRQAEQLKLQRDRIKAEVLQGVIGTLDDIDLAFQNVPEEIGEQLLGWVEGFRLVQRKLNKILDDQNVMVINTEGEFDPNLHEAVSYEDSNDHEESQIIGQLRKGYQIGNRVLRPALVRVAK